MKVTENWRNKSRKPWNNEDYLQRDSAEHEGYAGVLTENRITENNNTNANVKEEGLLEAILNPDNLNKAYKRVMSNKGAHGVDGMGIESLLQYLKDNGEQIRKSILDGKYRPNPVRRVEIPKENGKRILGIPTVVDRVIQQATTQILSPIFELQFSNASYGFRPGRSQHDALKKCIEYANEGYVYVVDMDLEKFFDTVNQSKMIEILSRTIKDGRVVSLIHKYLRAGAEEHGEILKTEIGLAQGGNISPLCSNIILNELDHELERRGVRFVRYADDVLLFAKSERAANRILEHIRPYIENKLFLKVNMEKTGIARITDKTKYLGYGFYKSKDDEIRLYVHDKSTNKMKARIKDIIKRGSGNGYEKLKLKLKQYINGWVNYFILADMKGLLTNIDKWLRRLIRKFIWDRWKKVRTRIAMLIKLGLCEDNAIKFGNTRKGSWRTAGSPILSTTITNKRLIQAGYTFFTDYYNARKA